MSHRDGEGDVSHPLPADLLLGNFYTAPVADDSLVADPLVFSAVALVVLGRAEDLLAEESVHLRLVCPVVDGLWLGHLTMGPRYDVLRRGQRDADLVEVAADLVVFIIGKWHISD